MAFKKSKKQLNEEYKFVIDCARECSKEDAVSMGIHRLATQLGYLDAALQGGKINAKEAQLQAKDLYKAWKHINKQIEKEWRKLGGSGVTH